MVLNTIKKDADTETPTQPKQETAPNGSTTNDTPKGPVDPLGAVTAGQQ